MSDADVVLKAAILDQLAKLEIEEQKLLDELDAIHQRVKDGE